MAFVGGDASTHRRASLGSVARQAAESSLADSGFTTACKFPQDLWPVEIDQRQMEQVICNLVLNARESEPRDQLVRVEAANERLAVARGGLEPGDYVWLIDPALKTIVISGYAFDNTLRDFTQHGFCDAIAKPFDVTTLKRALERNGV